MIAADTNLLVYSHRIDSTWHEPARECIRSLAEGSEPWAIAWPCLHEFYAVVTHPRIYRPPSTVPSAPEQAGRPSRDLMLRWADPAPGRPRLCGLRSAVVPTLVVLGFAAVFAAVALARFRWEEA